MASRSQQRILDSHIHLWDLDNNYYPWLSDNIPDPEESGLSGFAAIARNYLVEDYLADAEGYEILGAVHIEAQWDPSDPLGETRWLTQLARSSADQGLVKATVGHCNLASENCEEVLEAQAEYESMRAIRQMLNYVEGNPALCWAAEDFTANEKWRSNYGLLKKYGLGFDLMCFSNMMPRMADLARQHPETMIFLEHAGMPHEHDKEGREKWRAGMRALAANDNVVTKISGLGNTIPDWNEELIRPYVLDAIDIFGVDRVMFASNFPTDKMYSSMDAIWQAFLSITAAFSQDEKDRMYAHNAVRYYKLNR